MAWPRGIVRRGQLSLACLVLTADIALSVSPIASDSARGSRDSVGAPSGGIVQIRGPRGCVLSGRSDSCTRAHALDRDYGVAIAVAPDGRTVYVGSELTFAVAVLSRGDDDGGLTQPTEPSWF
jgi:hypothetical protein